MNIPAANWIVINVTFIAPMIGKTTVDRKDKETKWSMESHINSPKNIAETWSHHNTDATSPALNIFFRIHRY